MNSVTISLRTHRALLKALDDPRWPLANIENIIAYADAVRELTAGGIRPAPQQGMLPQQETA